jgi:hypothetical protein
MENYISLSPNPVTVSYLQHFQVAQVNHWLFIKEERMSKRKRKTRPAVKRHGD